MIESLTERGRPRMQLFVHPDEPSREHFDAPENDEQRLHKPKGGLWTSPVRGSKSPWIEWVDQNDFYSGEERVFAIVPAECTVLTIDSNDDMHSVLDEYSRDLSDIPGLAGDTYAPFDFEAISDDYDAIHLTSDGQVETRLSRPGLYGWDCESFLWLNWCVEEWHELFELEFCLN